MTEPEKKYVAGDGARSIRSSKLFRVINFELYSKPVRTSIDIFS